MPDMDSARTRMTHFLQTEIWRLSKNDLPRLRGLLLRPLQILLLAIQGYIRDSCTLRSSALTFYSLLSTVPFIALAFGIAKGFGLDEMLEGQLYQRFAGQEAAVDKVVAFARSLLSNTQGGLIAGIGVALLFWSAVKGGIGVQRQPVPTG